MYIYIRYLSLYIYIVDIFIHMCGENKFVNLLLAILYRHLPLQGQGHGGHLQGHLGVRSTCCGLLQLGTTTGYYIYTFVY